MGVLSTPKDAYIPTDEMWVELMKVGEWLPGNRDTPIDFSSDYLSRISEKSKQALQENKFPIIKIGHNDFGSAKGMLNDIRFNTDKNALEGKIGYFTNDLVSELNQGKYPFRSVEIDQELETVVGLAMVSQPAVEGMQLNPMALSKSEDMQNVLIFEMKNNLEVIMPNDKTPEPVQDKVNEVITFSKEQLEEFEALKAEKEKWDAEKAELEKQQSSTVAKFAAQQQDLEHSLIAMQTELKRKELASFAEKNKIPVYSSSELVEILFSIEKKPNEILEFSADKKNTPVEFMKNIISAYSATLDKMTKSEISKPKIAEGVMVFNQNNEEEIAKKILQYSREKNISPDAAYFELKDQDIFHIDE